MAGNLPMTMRQFRAIGLRQVVPFKFQGQQTPIHNPSTRLSGKKEPRVFRNRSGLVPDTAPDDINACYVGP
jgi:hypothetical protein